MVAKKRGGRYLPGQRTGAWIKVKVPGYALGLCRVVQANEIGTRVLKRVELRRTPGTGLAATATFVIASAIAVLLLMPSQPGAGIVSDEVAHLLAFTALAFPLSLVRARFAAFIFIGVCAYGAGIELLQPFFGRAAEWSDLTRDAAGALLGATAGAAMGRIWRS